MAARIRRPVHRKVPGLVPAPRRQSAALPLRLLGVSALIAVLFGLAALVYSTNPFGGSPGAGMPALADYVVYAQFGPEADVIYEASAANPLKRRRLSEVRHAREFGIVPSISPDGRQFAYLALPETNLEPDRDAPAEVWVASFDASRKPAMVGEGFFLQVRPLWSPDGSGLVVRRTTPDGAFQLVRIDLATAGQSALVSSFAPAFPVAFSTDGKGLYFVTISVGPAGLAGTDLHLLDITTATVSRVAHLSDDLTRDWTLSPSGDRLAYIARVAEVDGGIFTRVLVTNLASGETTSSGLDTDEFSPQWSPAGDLTYGRVGASRQMTGLVVGGGSVAAPAIGFDVPLAWSRSGSGIVVRSFDGPSVTAPGRAMLTLVTPSGSRKTIANGEVTFIGWTYR